jgi:outer membrane protein assembly factor BamB
MRESWSKRIRILITVITLSFTIVCIISNITFKIPFSSNKFPLEEKWSTSLKSDVEQITIIDNRLIIAKTLTNIYAIDLKSGDILWLLRLSRHFSNQPVFANDSMLFLTDGKGSLALNQIDGKVIWQNSIGYPLSAEIVDVTQDLVAVNDPPFLGVYQAKDGALLWKKYACRGPIQAYFFDTNIVVPCHGLTVFDAHSGETVWETKVDYSVDQVKKSTYTDGVIYYSQDSKSIISYDLTNRKFTCDNWRPILHFR